MVKDNWQCPADDRAVDPLLITSATNVDGLFHSWSPDGAKISYYMDNELWIVNADGSNNHQLYGIGEVCEDKHSWSPYAEHVALAIWAEVKHVSYVMVCAAIGHHKKHFALSFTQPYVSVSSVFVGGLFVVVSNEV